jgi:hypothetical protein
MLRIFGPKGEDETRHCRKMRNEELHNFILRQMLLGRENETKDM